MTLRLRVVSDQRRSLGDRSSIVFAVDGGTIGRSADNDWVLPDPLRYVSAHHARVQFKNGRFVLLDLSTNGVFVNDETEQPRAEAGASGASAVPTSIHALHTYGRAAQTDIGAMLNLDDLLVPESPTGEEMLPVNAYGQAVMQAPVRQLVTSPRPVPNTDPDEDSLARRVERLAKAARKDITNGVNNAPAAPNNAQLFDVTTGLQVFCRGAGIDAEKLPADAQTRFLHLAGQLFREALLGYKELDRSRSDSRNRFRIELPPPEPDDPRPSLSRSTAEELLDAVTSTRTSR